MVLLFLVVLSGGLAGSGNTKGPAIAARCGKYEVEEGRIRKGSQSASQHRSEPTISFFYLTRFPGICGGLSSDTRSPPKAGDVFLLGTVQPLEPPLFDGFRRV